MRNQLRSGWSALRYSIQAYSPYYAPPLESTLDPKNIVGTSTFASFNPPASSQCNARSGIVSRRNMMTGDREIYARGSQLNSGMRMMATGRVESSRAQPFTGWTWNASMNDFLYRAGGYPQNLGLSFKAPSIPDGVVTTPQWGRMRPAPQYTRTVFTNRRFAGAPSVPAQPRNR